MELRNNEQRAKTAIIFIWIVTAFEIISSISSFMQYNLLQTVANGGYITDEAATANDAREQIIGIVTFIAYVISGTTFILWFRRAYYNLHQKVNHLSYSDGWATGSWFVPIICLYRPYQIMKELYMQTKGLLMNRNLSDKVRYDTTYLGWWWTLWIIAAFIGNFIFRYTLKDTDTIDELITLTIAQMISSILEIPLAIITAKIIRDYSTVEPALFEIVDNDNNLTVETE
jgi:hypothetical protein